MNTSISLSNILRQQVAEEVRPDITADLFGINFPLRLEPFVYSTAKQLSADYRGGYWTFFTLSNGCFYMAPAQDEPFLLSCENGFTGKLSADAFGITACLYAYSHLSFDDDPFAETYARQFHWLRDFALVHKEARQIMQAID